MDLININKLLWSALFYFFLLFVFSYDYKWDANKLILGEPPLPLGWGGGEKIVYKYFSKQID
jgi:hypothetical protein